MKKLLLIGLIFFLYYQTFAQVDSIKIEFIIIAKEIQNNETIYIAGNTKNLGNWAPDVVKLNQVSDSKFVGTFLFPINTNIEFKFTKGSWATEALKDDGSTQANYRVKATADSTIIVKISKWGNMSNPIVEGQITGIVEYIEAFKTREILLPRDIIIWLPPGYNENKNQRYPVLYMHDGQNIIDPSTSFLGVDWQIDETADSLIRGGKIEPIIIVGLYNTAKRKNEYSENDTGYTYIDFLVNDVKPMIDKKFRTKPDKENTAVAGSSMGGLISFIIAWERPDVFSKAACLSPAFKIRKYDYVDNVIAYNGEKKLIQLYIDNGTVGLEDSLQGGINEMLKALEKKGYDDKDKEFVFYKEIGAEHKEAAWAKRNWRYLELFFGKNNENKSLSN